MFLPASISFLGAALSACALVFGARRLALALAAPALWRWIVFPLIQRLAVEAPPWFLLALSAMFVVILPFLALRMLQGVLRLAYGEHAAAHVSAVFLVRLLDGLGAVIGRLLVSVGRLFGLRRRG